MRIEPINIRNATERQYAAYNAFLNVMRAERLPGDPPIPLEEDMRRWRTIPSFLDLSVWIGIENEAVVAYASTTIQRVDENRHMFEFGIEVHATHRRRGIGTRLLDLVADLARREERRLLITSSRSTIPAAEGFLRRIGATVGLETHTNQLDLNDLNRDLIQLWQARAKERAAGFEILLWTGGFPEEHLEQFAELIGAMNRAPRGTLQLEDFRTTPEQLRQWDQAMRERGIEHWTMIARERATGRFAGFTEVTWHPNRPEFLSQEGTAVKAEFQNLGLGRWLKAAMLDKVLRERPQVKRVRTGNADSNAPMLKINYELGFRPYISQSAWQVELSQVQAYLDSVRDTKLAAVKA